MMAVVEQLKSMTFYIAKKMFLFATFGILFPYSRTKSSFIYIYIYIILTYIWIKIRFYIYNLYMYMDLSVHGV